MTNEQRAEALIQTYGFDFDYIPKEVIRHLIEEEILNYHPGSSEYIRLLCGYLYCIGDRTDISLIEQAKYSINMDVGCMIDGEWIGSLERGGAEEEEFDSRRYQIESFISYYEGFKASDLEDD